MNRVFATLVCCLVLGHSGEALAQSKAACMEGYEEAQVARQDGRFISARESLLRCSSDACPEFIRTECYRWLEEVSQSIPSFVVIANTAEGEPLRDVELTLDGELLTRALGTRAIDADPGEHTLLLSHQGETLERRIVLREGERNQQVVVEFDLASTSSAAPSGNGVAQDRERFTGSNAAAVYALGGLGVAGLVAFTYLGLDGVGERRDMKGSCAPHCPQDQIDDVRRKFLYADIGLGVGVVSLVGATYLYLSGRRSQEDQSARSRRYGVFSAVPVSGGGVGTWRTDF